jgi:hypothetical protein
VTDAIHFEVANLGAAVRLTRRLAQTWPVVLREHRRSTLVTVALREPPDDFAVLLREVESWVADESLSTLRYEFDGRPYVLEAAAD